MNNLKIGDILIDKIHKSNFQIINIVKNPLGVEKDIFYSQYSAYYRKDIPIYFDLVENKKGHILTSVFK